MFEDILSGLRVMRFVRLAPEFAHMAIAIMENKYMNGESIRVDGGIRMGKL